MPEYVLASLHQHKCRVDHLGMPVFCENGCSIKTWYQFNFLICAMRKDSNLIFLMLLRDIFGLVLES